MFIHFNMNTPCLISILTKKVNFYVNSLNLHKGESCSFAIWYPEIPCQYQKRAKILPHLGQSRYAAEATSVVSARNIDRRTGVVLCVKCGDM